MKVSVKYFYENQKSKTLEIELDEKLSLEKANKIISETIKNNIILVPAKTSNISKLHTIAEYCKENQNTFIAVNPSILTHNELEILTPFSLNNLLTASDKPILSAKELIHFLHDYLPEDIQDSLLVRLADKTTMYGKTYKDSLTDEAKLLESRYSVQVHPYPWVASGASNVIVHKNKEGELAIALVHNRRRDKRAPTNPLKIAGIPDYWKLPEGHMDAKPCKGGENAIALVSPDDMDEAEELLVKNVPMKDAYKTIKDKKKDHPSIPSHSYDKNLKECAARECQEEVGLTIPPDHVQIVGWREENHIIPSIETVNLIPFETKDQTPPNLKVDGLEIQNAIWGKLNEFKFDSDRIKSDDLRVTLNYAKDQKHYPVEIPMKYALMIGQAIKKYRENEIKYQSDVNGSALFDNRQNVEARVKQILVASEITSRVKSLSDIVGLLPEEIILPHVSLKNLPGEDHREKRDNLSLLAELGEYAGIYHNKILKLAYAFKMSPLDRPLQAEDLYKIVRTEPAKLSQSIHTILAAKPVEKDLHHHNAEQELTCVIL